MCPPTVPILSQIHTVLNFTSHFPKLHRNIILPSTRVSQVVSFPQVSPPKLSTHISPSPYALHSPPIIILGKQYRSLSSSLSSFLLYPVTLSLLEPNVLLNTLFSYTLILRSSLNVSDQVSHPYKKHAKLLLLL